MDYILVFTLGAIGGFALRQFWPAIVGKLTNKLLGQ